VIDLEAAMPLPTDEVDRTTPGTAHAVAMTLGWGLAAACVAGNVWALGTSVLQHQQQIDLLALGLFIRSDPLALLGVFGAGAVVGFILASFAAFLRGARGTSALDAGWWGAATGGGWVATTLAYPHVIVAAGSHLPPLLSSALCFVAWGFVVGSCGYVWSCRSASRQTEREGDPDGTHAEKPGAGTAWVPDEPRPSRRLTARTRAVLRLLPIGLVTVVAFAGAAILSPSPAAFGPLCVGLLGLSLMPVVWRHGRRLAKHKRRPRRLPHRD
jgi:hypothetical protein